MIKNGFFSKKRLMAMSLATSMLLSASACGKAEESADLTTEAMTEVEVTEEASVTDGEDSEATNTSAEAVDTSATDVSEDEIEVPEGFSLVWHDEFNGTELNEADWNREEHQVGWVNNELQEYIPTDEYSFVKNGELVIQPKKFEDEDGNVSYASGRVNTQNKHDVSMDALRRVSSFLRERAIFLHFG